MCLICIVYNAVGTRGILFTCCTEPSIQHVVDVRCFVNWNGPETTANRHTRRHCAGWVLERSHSLQGPGGWSRGLSWRILLTWSEQLLNWCHTGSLALSLSFTFPPTMHCFLSWGATFNTPTVHLLFIHSSVWGYYCRNIICNCVCRGVIRFYECVQESLNVYSRFSSLTEKREMSTTCKHCISRWCSFSVFPMQSATLLGFGKDSHRTWPRSLVWKSCVWPIQPPHFLHLWTCSLNCRQTTTNMVQARFFQLKLVWKWCWVSRKKLTIRVQVHKFIDYISLLFHEMLWYWTGCL